VTDRSYLSIGDVLALLRGEFPDITISKIRFLESRGLLDPERTPSGYRKFYEPDVERLRWILRQQREHFLPLKIIKGRLERGSSEEEERPSLFDAAGEPAPQQADEAELVTVLAWSRQSEAAAVEPNAPGRWPPGAGEDPLVRDPEQHASRSGHARPAKPARVPGEGRPRLAKSEEAHEEDADSDEESLHAAGHEQAREHRNGTDAAQAVTEVPAAVEAEAPGDSVPADEDAAPGSPEGRRRGGRAGAGALAPPRASNDEGGKMDEIVNTRSAGKVRGRRGRTLESGASLTPAELSEASGLEIADIDNLEEFGLLTSRTVAGVRCYDEEGLVVARLAARFARYGVEARHLRTFKHAAEREAGLFEQLVIPLLRQRNPEARARATVALEELTELGAALQASLLAAALRDVTG
jgi:DNA-binding transcriptional MerR regulator